MVTYMNPNIGSGYAVDKNFLRIGDTQFYVPPTSIKVHRQSQIEMDKMIRSKNSSPRESGYYEQIIEFNIIFPDLYSINNELRPLLAQTKKFPFLPVENTYLNDALSIEAVTITNITCQTVVGFPNCISSIVQAYAFDPGSYVYGDEGTYDEMFNWPLFRWHYNRNLKVDAKKEGLTYFERITTDLHNEFKFKVAAEDELEYMREWRKTKNELLRTWRNDRKNKTGYDSEDWGFEENKWREMAERVLGSEAAEGYKNHWNDENDEKQFWTLYNEHMKNKMNTYDISYEPIVIPGLTLLDMSVSMSNDIATHRVQMNPYSTHQFLGSSDITASLRFLVPDEEVLAVFDQTLNKAAYLVKEFNKEMANGFIKFEHQLTRLFGIENVVIGDVSYNTIANQPGVHEVNMIVYGYNRAEKRMHETQAMMKSKNINNWKIDENQGSLLWNIFNQPGFQKNLKKFGEYDATMSFDEHKQAVYEARAMEIFKAIELYPDLELPTYNQVKEAGFDVLNLNDGIFVDPDFFLKYNSNSYMHNIMIEEMKKQYNIDLIDSGGGGATMANSNTSTAKLNEETTKEIEEINKELGIDTASKEGQKETQTQETKDVDKKYPAKQSDTKVTEAWIREEADVNQFPQNYALGFASYFDKELRHTYEKGTNTAFGQISADADDVVIEMNSITGYVAGEYKKNNYVGVFRVPFITPEIITSVHGNITAGVSRLAQLYKKAFVIVENGDGYKNIEKAYTSFNIGTDGDEDDKKSRLQLAIASIMYMGGEVELREYLSGKIETINKDYIKLAQGVIENMRSFKTGKWSDEKIAEQIGKNKIEDFATSNYSKDMASEPATFEDNVITGTNNDNVVRNAMFVDALKYDKRGRMVRAFPTFLLLFVDEGQYIGSVKMADQYFNYRAIRDVVFNSSRNQAAPTLMLELSNIYETLSDAEKAEDLSHQGLKDMLTYWMFPGKYAADTQDRSRNMEDAYYKSVYLRTGVRIHFRMGYGSNPAELPTLINGPITSIKNNGHSMSIICQGDGIELTRKLSAWFDPNDETTGFLWGKQEPTEVLDKILTDDRGIIASAKTLISNKEYQHHSLGLMHFGSPGLPVGAEHLKSSSIGGIAGASVGAIFAGPAGAVLGGALGASTGWAISANQNALKREIQSINMNVHKTTGIQNGTETIWNRLGDYFGMGQGDEDGVAFSLFDKTVWDVACINASIGTDMLAAVHTFGMRSTLFVGKPYFPIHYNYMVDLENDSVIGTEVKTFRQIHTADSYTNIITNNIEATEENMYTTAIGTYMRNGELAATDTVYVDTNIWPEKQKNVNIDTTLDAKGFRLLKGLGTIPVLGGIADVINSGTGQHWFDRKVALKITHSGLRDHVKNMYDGYLTIMGMGAIKPYDHIMLQDMYTNMGGTFEVREVTHMLNNDVGFVTMIKPDVIVYNSDEKIPYFVLAGAQLATAFAFTWILRKMLRNATYSGSMPILNSLWAATKWMWKKTVTLNSLDKFYEKMSSKLGRRKTPDIEGTTGNKEEILKGDDDKRNKDLVNPDLTETELELAKKKGLLQKAAFLMELDGNTIEELIKNGGKNMRSRFPKPIANLSTKAQGLIGKSVSKTFFNKRFNVAAKIAKGGKNAYRFFRSCLAAATGPIGIIGFAIEFAVIEILTATVGEFINKWLANRQACTIIPLKKDGVRMLAGVNGHKGSVAGDSKDTVGSIVTNPVVSFALSMIGVDTSRYSNVPEDVGDYGVSANQVSINQLSTMSLLDSIKEKLPSLGFKGREDTSETRSAKFLHRLDIAGLKAQINNDKTLMEKLQSLLPNYSEIKETFSKIAIAEGSKLGELIESIKGLFGGLWDNIKGLFEGILGDGEDGSNMSCTSSMPTSANYTGPSTGAHGQKNLKSRIAGTDKYNDLIFKVAKQKNLNPVFVKVILAIETAGKKGTVSSANCYGLMQVRKADNPSAYDWDRMLTDDEYALAAGCDKINEKIKTAQRLKKNQSIRWVAQYYYGYREGWDDSYGRQAEEMYKGLGFNPETTDALSQVVDGECTESSFEGTGEVELINGLNPSDWPTDTKWGGSSQRAARKSASKNLVSANSKTCPDISFPFGGVKMRKDARTICNAVAKDFKAKFGIRMKITSAYRAGESASWHATGWGVDIDTYGTDNGGHMITFKGGLRGHRDGPAYEQAKFLADRFIHYGYDGLIHGDTRIGAEMKKKYPGISYKAKGYTLGDHDGHLHLNCPNQKRLKKK